MSLLTRDQVRAWVPQVDGVAELVADAIEMAEELAEQVCGRGLALLQRTEKYTIGEDQSAVALLAYPVSASAAFTVTQNANSASPITVASTEYTLDRATGILSALNGTWLPGVENLQVVYTAGYTTATLPAGLRRALLQLVAWVLESRGNVGTRQESVDGQSVTYEEMDGPVPASISRALQPWKAVRIG